jgi:ribosomal protein L32E
MPYNNLPEEEWGKMDVCVKNIRELQKVDQKTAIAMCYSSIHGKSEKKEIHDVKKEVKIQQLKERYSKEQIEQRIKSLTSK